MCLSIYLWIFYVKRSKAQIFLYNQYYLHAPKHTLSPQVTTAHTEFVGYCVWDCVQVVLNVLWRVVCIKWNILLSTVLESKILHPRIVIWRRQWHPTPVLLSGKSHGQRTLVGCSPWAGQESDTAERLHLHFHALGKEMATHSSVLAWRIPEKEEPGGLPSVGLHRVGHD